MLRSKKMGMFFAAIVDMETYTSVLQHSFGEALTTGSLSRWNTYGRNGAAVQDEFGMHADPSLLHTTCSYWTQRRVGRKVKLE